MPRSIPLVYYPLLLRPARIRERLARLRAVGRIAEEPNLWQVFLGTCYMWHRLLFRPETVGTASSDAVRSTWRARLLSFRPLRMPFLLAERAIAPLDFSGLAGTAERNMRHVLGAYHPGENFVYDLQILESFDGALDELLRRVEAVVEGRDARAEWLRDLAVYQGYHERLHARLRRYLDGERDVSEDFGSNPDTSLPVFLRWCARQPPTPRDTLRAVRDGTLSFAPVA